jgi:alpha-L-arabinofuranosidase
MAVECALTKGTAASARARIIHHADFNACNTFEAPEVIVPKDHPVTAQGSKIRIELPPMAVATILAQLAST